MIQKALLCTAAAFLLMVAAPSRAQDTQQDTQQGTQAQPADGISLELNKLEPSDKGCRVYVVVTNQSAATFDAYKLDLVMFQTDGVIGRRFSVDLAPLRPSKRTVKPFELDGTSCDNIGSFLVNDVMECRSSTGPVDDCLARMKVSSLTKIQIAK